MNSFWVVGRMAIYIILSLLAIYGFIHLVNDIIAMVKTGCKSCGGRLCLFPRPGDEGLEGKIRSFFIDEISEKLGTDGCLYIRLEENDPNTELVKRLCLEYSRLVLLDNMNWGRMDGESLKVSE